MVEESRELTIRADPERLEDGSPEERACFAAIAIQYGGTSLTQGHDGFVNKVRPAPLLSGYHLAEWIAWNWWRLRWEPRSKAPNWEFAHRLTTIGEGYIWPNVTIFSDGERVALIAKPTLERPNTPFRYLSDATAVVGAREFEYAADQFVEQARGLLRTEQIRETNLDRIWNDIQDERGDAENSRRRKLEALLGYDPDEADEAILVRLLTDASALGESAINEIAADYPQGGELLSAETLSALAASQGFDASRRDITRLAPGKALPRAGHVPAWQLGTAAAKALRDQERLGAGPISNGMLAKMAGIRGQALTDRTPGPTISFALDSGVDRSKVVLRSRWLPGRRFELARLLGDRVVSPAEGPLFAATRAYTYRQKMQRSFAAEFLSPFESIDAMLSGDYSIENQQDAAGHFQVSELTIRTLMVNHRRLQREELNEEFDIAAA